MRPDYDYRVQGPLWRLCQRVPTSMFKQANDRCRHKPTFPAMYWNDLSWSPPVIPDREQHQTTPSPSSTAASKANLYSAALPAINFWIQSAGSSDVLPSVSSVERKP